jgi:putative ABC transport system permease protein
MRTFTITAILVIALATGANTAVFGLVYSVVFRPLPFPEPSRLVSVTKFYPTFNESVVSSPNYFDWRDGSSGLAQLAAYSMGEYTLTNDAAADRVAAGLVSHEFFDVLGVHPKLGRNFSADEDRPGADNVVIVSEAFSKERKIELDGRRYTVIGVMPESFAFPPGVKIWIPLALNPAERGQGGPVQLVRVIGRLGIGRSPSALAAGLQTISEHAAQSWTSGARMVILPLRVWLTGKTEQVWFILLGAVLLVLLIACTNVAGLLIARCAGRRQEMAIRLALGASIARLRQQLLTESLLLGTAGSVLGFLLAAGLIHVLLPLIPYSMLVGRPVHLDAPVFCFTALVAVATSLLFGAAPAREAGRVNVSDALKQGSHTTTQVGRSVQMRSALVTAEIALSVALVVTACLLARSFIALTKVDPGFRPDHVLTFSVNLPTASYRDVRRQHEFYGRAIEAAATLPEVHSAALVSALPFSPANASRALVSAEGEAPWGPADSGRHRVESVYVSADYFRAMGIPFVEGRTFAPDEMTEKSQSVVINESLARRFFGGPLRPLRRLKTGLSESPSPWLTVVGVVRDSRRTGLDNDVAPSIFRPYQESNALRSAGFILRCATELESVSEIARRTFARLDREVALSDVQSMQSRLSGSMASQRLRSIAAALLAFLAVAIVLTGLYGLISYIVSQRTAELGVRMALGAKPSSIFGLVLRQGLTLTLIGTLVGVALSMATSRLLRGLLFSVGPTDALTLCCAALGMLAITAVACAGPAHRATRIDPMRCLRQE